MDIFALRERSFDALSVSELNSRIKNLIEFDRGLKSVSVKGEISNFTAHRSGHLYFTLKDDYSQIKAIMFRSSAQGLKFMPEEGMKVNVRASVGVYTQGGTYQLYVTSITPDGLGSLYLAYEQLKARLAEEGLFDSAHKQDIPKMPTRVGIITSPTGAAVRDIINISRRRFPQATLYLYPALVQGAQAALSLIKALDYLDKSELCDVIIIGRGGGSLEDLYAFNSEELARCIYAAKTPIISAVGHETDFTICDFVADLRAPTPSAAAELALPDARELMERLDILYTRASLALARHVELSQLRFNKLREIIKDFDSVLAPKQDSLFQLLNRLKLAMERKISESSERFGICLGKIHALSPLATLSRGYTVATTERGTVKSVTDVSIGDTVSLRLTDGALDANITNLRKSTKQKGEKR